jgi:peptide deformylase
MALLKIAKMGNPVLRARAAEVADSTAPWVRKLVEDMLETMEDAGGTGIAAPQVHAPHRIVTFFVGGERTTELPGDGPQDLTVLVNPVIEPIGNEMALGWEGCLSVPGSMASRSSARRPDFTPVSCSMNATISTAFSTRSG